MATAHFSAMQSERIVRRFNFVTIDTEILHNWNVDSVTKRIIAVAAFLLLVAGSVPLLTSVRGQTPNSPLDYEVRDLRQKVDKLDSVPTEIALILAHQKIEDERYQEQQEFEGKIIWGFVGTSGSILMALFLWVLHQFGITFGSEKRRRHA